MGVHKQRVKVSGLRKTKDCPRGRGRPGAASENETNTGQCQGPYMLYRK